mmetsp:Transcript_117378/g.292641  ORF Transcript_117378/g.292641 Transcript_117378/m.292641 type:complete len:230 (+) Transcript_117378:137-826(+)
MRSAARSLSSERHGTRRCEEQRRRAKAHAQRGGAGVRRAAVAAATANAAGCRAKLRIGVGISDVEHLAVGFGARGEVRAVVLVAIEDHAVVAPRTGGLALGGTRGIGRDRLAGHQCIGTAGDTAVQFDGARVVHLLPRPIVTLAHEEWHGVDVDRNCGARISCHRSVVRCVHKQVHRVVVDPLARAAAHPQVRGCDSRRRRRRHRIAAARAGDWAIVVAIGGWQAPHAV